MRTSRKRVKKNLRRTKRNDKKQGGMIRLGKLKKARPISPPRAYAWIEPYETGYPRAEATRICYPVAVRDDADLNQQLDEIYQDLNNPLKVITMIIENELKDKLIEIFERYPDFDVKRIYYNPEYTESPEYTNKSLLDYAMYMDNLELVNLIINHESVTREFLEDSIVKSNANPPLYKKNKRKIREAIEKKMGEL